MDEQTIAWQADQTTFVGNMKRALKTMFVCLVPASSYLKNSAQVFCAEAVGRGTSNGVLQLWEFDMALRLKVQMRLQADGLSASTLRRSAGQAIL
jgi:hypothetical protein